MHICSYVCTLYIATSMTLKLYSVATMCIHVDSLTDSKMWLDAITQNAWDTGLYIS